MAVNRDFIKNYSMNGGELLIKFPEDNHFKYFCATTECNITYKSDKVEHKNSEDDTISLDMDVVKEVSASLKVTTEDFNKRVLALAFGGDFVTTSQASATGTENDFSAVVALAIYDLTAVAVSNVTVTYGGDNDDDNTAVEGVDYSVNYKFGSIEIAKDGAIVGQDIKVTFDNATEDITEFTSLNNTSREVQLKFVSASNAGKEKATTIHRVVLSLNGDMALKSPEKFNSLSFDGKILKDSTKAEGKQFVETVLLG